MLGGRRSRILDFDLECRPGFWYGGDWVSKIIAAAAWKWVGEKGRVRSEVVIGLSKVEMLRVVKAVSDAIREADVVTGHYIRGFDLPLLNGAMMRLGLPSMPVVMAQDTKTDLDRAHGLSKSLENLGAMFELRHPKVHMGLQSWEDGLVFFEPAGLIEVRKRVEGDVLEHVELRARLLAEDRLSPPAVWTPSTHARAEGRYAP